jgi:hypothetical protein
MQALGCCIPDIVTLIHYHMSLNMNSNPAMHPSFRLLNILLNIDVLGRYRVCDLFSHHMNSYIVDNL